MQNSFLEYVLKDLHSKQVNIPNCTFVLPSKRSGTFLKKHISKVLGKSVFGPRILSIEDFITKISGLSTASNVDLLLRLYGVYRQTIAQDPDDFDTFLKWGQTLLQDFNEIDRYLIPPKDILSYMSAVKELNHWSLQNNTSELVRNYLKFWNNLHGLYNAFSSQLLQERKGNQGLIYRTAAENVASGAVLFEEAPIVFIGFNALNTAEEQIIQHYLSHPSNTIYWDIDSYFLEDTIHDAGLFIRGYKQHWGYYQDQPLRGIQDNFLGPKNISITGVPKSISQAQYIGNLLSQIHMDSTVGLQNTALVLADETLLNPTLQAIPSAIQQVNITMGQPLNKTVLYSFFLSHLDLQLSSTEKGWFYADILSFFSNPFTNTLSLYEEVDIVSMITKDIKQNNRLYLHQGYFQNYAHQTELISLIFPNSNPTAANWIDHCLLLIQKLKSIHQQNKAQIELEYLYRFYNLFNQLKQQIEKVTFLTALKSIKGFFKQLAASETADFVGEPLSGLQIMGMLESRNLDFETVIIASVNEGILPSGKSNNSFFPFDVKREFGLPTYKEKDAIYTYHFYRLIQRAKNVHLLYNTEPDVLEGGEKSRLISQLLADGNIANNLTHSIASPSVEIVPTDTCRIEKSESLLKDITAFASRGFSPTSLTNYVRNPMDFYKRNILKIYDTEDVEETIAANTFGTIIHDSLEKLYDPLINTTLSKENIDGLRNEVTDVVKSKFKEILPGVDIQKGRYLLVFQVVLKYLNNFLDLELKEIQRHEIKILALEEKYEIEIEVPGLGFPIKLKGTLDRVDQIDGQLRIVDYKTGKVEPKNVKVKDWDELITNYDKSKAFQLLCYAYLYQRKFGQDTMIAGIYTFKNLGQGFLPFSSATQTIDKEVLVKFESYLQQLILDICNPNIPFEEKDT
ncbi:PD-(D/E)XK nuclease family protein [Flagellimonas myxillae]|uniref:PD-(D/E)XK nuclease family protein n=1 Tax=Flagellimonas myxillae TaxID=2942214 RepID=UPI00201EB722|nr:PD-(D/E)XK nuclease family protein [Muricauda myxillae]MCL6267340.1 PD-(D/E)XK nuclease family protein [Muricauda myxillae]